VKYFLNDNKNKLYATIIYQLKSNAKLIL